MEAVEVGEGGEVGEQGKKLFPLREGRNTCWAQRHLQKRGEHRPKAQVHSASLRSQLSDNMRQHKSSSTSHHHVNRLQPRQQRLTWESWQETDSLWGAAQRRGQSQVGETRTRVSLEEQLELWSWRRL